MAPNENDDWMGPPTVRYQGNLDGPCLLEDLGPIDLSGIKWIVVGGGKRSRCSANDEGVGYLVREQCEREGVSFFFKQWGGVRKGKAGRELDGRCYNSMPRRSDYPALPESDRKRLLIDLEKRLSAVRQEQFTFEHPASPDKLS